MFDRHPELHKHLTEEELRGYMGKQRMEVAAVMMPMAPPERWYDLMEELFAEQLPYLREHHAAPYPHLAQTLEALSALPECTGRVVLLPYRAVGVAGALLPAFRPDSVRIGGAAEPMLLALSAQALTSDGAFAMVLPPKS